MLSRKNYFSGFGFSTEEVDKFFAVVARGAGEIASDFGAHFSLNDLRPYDVLPLAISPIILADDSAICPFFRLLMERMTTGLYHILFNAKPPGTAEGDRQRGDFQVLTGAVWEDYVDRLLRRAFGKAGANAPIYLGPQEMMQAVNTNRSNQPSVCDHMIVYGNKAVLLDSKAKFLPLNARSGLDLNTFVERFSSLVLDGARQLDATVKHIKQGRFDRPGIVGKDIDEIFPVLVSLADYPLRPWIYEWLHRRVRDAGYLSGEAVRPLELLMAGDMDALEQPMSAGHSLADILRGKLGDKDWATHSFHNYSVLKGPDHLHNSRSPYLDELYRDVSNRSLTLFAAATTAKTP